MKQLGAGIAQLLVGQRRRPARLPDYFTGGSGVASTWGAWSPQSHMFPYLEQGTLYNAINFWPDQPLNGSAWNMSFLGTRIASFLCPSAPLARATLHAVT